MAGGSFIDELLILINVHSIKWQNSSLMGNGAFYDLSVLFWDVILHHELGKFIRNISECLLIYFISIIK